jgi:hypothetical protein
MPFPLVYARSCSRFLPCKLSRLTSGTASGTASSFMDFGLGLRASETLKSAKIFNLGFL